MQVIYQSGRDTLVRIVVLCGIAAAVAGLYAAWEIFQSFGLSPADGGVLRPLEDRLAFAGAVAGLSLAVAGGLACYASLYVSTIEADPGNERYRVSVVSLLRPKTHDFDISQFRDSAFHHGQFRTIRAPSVNAPWVALHTTGRRIPFVLDAQGYADAKEIGKIAGAAAAAWANDEDDDE